MILDDILYYTRVENKDDDDAINISDLELSTRPTNIKHITRFVIDPNKNADLEGK